MKPGERLRVVVDELVARAVELVQLVDHVDVETAIVQFIVGAKVDGDPGPETRRKMGEWIDARITKRPTLRPPMP